MCPAHHIIKLGIALLIYLLPSLPGYARFTKIGADDSSGLALRYKEGFEKEILRTGFWDSLLKDAHQHKKLAIELKALDRKGLCLRIQGKTQEAVECYTLCAKKALDSHHVHELFAPLHHLAYHYFIQNDLKTSLDYYYKALRVAELLNARRDIITAKILLGHIYFRACKPKAALTQHLKSLQMAEAAGFREEIIKSLLGIGNDYMELKNYSACAMYYLKTVKFIDSLPQSALKAQVLNAIGAAHGVGGKHDSAAYYHQRSYEISKAINHAPGMASALVPLAHNNFERKRYPEAKRTALQALALVKATNFNGQMLSLALLLSNIYQAEGDYNTALKYYKLYSASHDSVTSEQIANEALERQYEYDLEKKEHANKLLAQQYRIQSLELKHNRNFTISIITIACLILVVSALFARQYRIHSKQHRAELEQKLLRAQMNPHFIFNSLQAIQNFVLKGNEKKTVKYLSSFANLTRHVLDSSRIEYISLKKEISLLNTYLELQKLRFDERFDYSIAADSNINPENVRIPAMLCQPFIENAVEHGMRDIGYGGIIAVSYRLIDNILQIEITDNGRGIDPEDRKAAQHQSMAIQITAERIALLNKNKKIKVSFEMTDAFPGHANKGVKVLFRFSGHPMM